MTTRRFPAPWRADKMPGGYLVRDQARTTMDLLRYLPGLVGVVAPFVAAVAGLLPAERKRAKRVYMIVGVALGFISFAATTIVDRERESRRHEVREQIGIFIQEGSALMRTLRDPQVPLQDQEANVWAEKVEAFLSEKLGASYVTRFESEANVPLGGPPGLADDKLRYWTGVRNRVAQLERFHAELPP